MLTTSRKRTTTSGKRATTTRTRKGPRKTEARVDEYEPKFRKPGNDRRGKTVVLYGRSGTGKTTLACTFPKPVILLDANDQGDESVSDIEGVEVVDITEWDEFELMWYWLKENAKDVGTVVVDTVSMLQGMRIKRLLADKKKAVRRAGDWGTMSKGDWGDVAADLKDWLTNYRDLPMNVVFIAQDRVFNFDEDTEDGSDLSPEVGPGVIPSVAKTMNAMVQVIGNTHIRKSYRKKKVNGKVVEQERTTYCLRIGPSSVYTTKVRKPKKIEVPAYIRDPEYQDIVDIIKGEYE